MNTILLYSAVFLASLLVDIVPFIGPPAWMVMVFFQVRFGLDIWGVLLVGVSGSAIGRYLYSYYISRISDHLISAEKNQDMRFIGTRISSGGWKVQAFVFLYTLMPLPSTPLFTAAGIARIKTLVLIPSFFAGKFLSDAAMVLAGDRVAHNLVSISQGLLSWKTILGTFLGLIVISFFLFINWRKLLLEKKFGLSFNIWK